MKLAVVGSRRYPRLDLVARCVSAQVGKVSLLVSGGAAGVDHVAAEAARACGLPVVEFLPDWNRHGRAAGMIRNQQIVDAADFGVAFWDEQSKGTADTIKKFRKAGKPLKVYGPDGKELAA